MNNTLEALNITRGILLETIVDIGTRISEIQQAENKPSYDWDDASIICELNGCQYLLGPESENKLTWEDAKVWCESVGGELPEREILLLAYLNETIKNLFKGSWYWSSTEFNATTAWRQNFSYGGQVNNDKDGTNYVRAVRKVLI